MLTNLALDFGGLSIYDLYPNPLPDLFAGNQILLAGRYRSGGIFELTLNGQVSAESVVTRYPGLVFEQDSRTDDAAMGSVARIWAARKIGSLLNQVRLNGPDEEIIAQIVGLSVRFGIVTPYTSYLVEEPMPLGVSAQNKMAEGVYNQAQATPMEVTGKGAVERAMQESELQEAAAVPQSGRAESGGSVVRTIGGRTYLYTQDHWTDTAYDPQTMAVVDVPFLSAAYFELAQSRPDLAAALALGERVIVVADGKVYRVSAEQAESMDPVAAIDQDTQQQQSTNPPATPIPEQRKLAETVTPEPTLNSEKGGGCPPVLMFVGLAMLVSFLKKKRLSD
jgi:Ca-activated chloride channel family protein